MTRQVQRSASSRLGEELASILHKLRQTAPASQLLSVGLDAIKSAIGADGVAIVRNAAGPDGPNAQLLHRAGRIGGDIAGATVLLVRAEIGGPAIARQPDGRPVIAAICHDNGANCIGLLAWRQPGSPAWTTDDATLVDALAGVVRLLHDAATKASQVVEAARIDPLTALLDQRAFLADATCHLVRLDHDGLPGTLILAEVDNLDSAAALLGAEGGEQVLRRAAVLLRSAVRPTDVVGRLSETVFAVWIDGADYLTAAERAEALCLEAPGKIVGPRHAMLPDVSFSIGIATRQTGEHFDEVLRRAADAVREVKQAGGGYWRVSRNRVS
jgi:diguanylate cyclase (GGDEF)-like protein